MKNADRHELAAFPFKLSLHSFCSKKEQNDIQNATHPDTPWDCCLTTPFITARSAMFGAMNSCDQQQNHKGKRAKSHAQISNNHGAPCTRP